MACLFRSVCWLCLMLVAAGGPISPTLSQDAKNPYAEMVGKPLPDYEADFAVDGKPVKLSDLKGKVVLLEVFQAHCEKCFLMMPFLKETHAKNQGKGLEVVSLTIYLGKEQFDKQKGKVVLTKEKVSREDEQQAIKDFAVHHKLEHRVMLLPIEKGKDAKPQALKLQKDFSGFRDMPVLVLLDREGVVRLVQPWASGKAPSLQELVGRQTKPVNDLLPKLLAQK